MILKFEGKEVFENSWSPNGLNQQISRNGRSTNNPTGSGFL